MPRAPHAPGLTHTHVDGSATVPVQGSAGSSARRRLSMTSFQSEQALARALCVLNENGIEVGQMGFFAATDPWPCVSNAMAGSALESVVAVIRARPALAVPRDDGSFLFVSEMPDCRCVFDVLGRDTLASLLVDGWLGVFVTAQNINEHRCSTRIFLRFAERRVVTHEASLIVNTKR
jgi:hypothetical protein